MKLLGLIAFLIGGCATTEKEKIEEICTDSSTEGHEILYQGRAYFDMEGDTLIIDSEEAWALFQESVLLSSDSDSFLRTDIDWPQEQVVVASAFVASTCGLYIQTADSCTKDDSATLQLVVDDFSGSCETVCEAEDQVLLVAAVPLGEVDVHTTIVPTCKEEG